MARSCQVVNEQSGGERQAKRDFVAPENKRNGPDFFATLALGSPFSKTVRDSDDGSCLEKVAEFEQHGRGAAENGPQVATHI